MVERDPAYMCEIQKDVYFLPDLLDFVRAFTLDALARDLFEC